MDIRWVDSLPCGLEVNLGQVETEAAIAIALETFETACAADFACVAELEKPAIAALKA